VPRAIPLAGLIGAPVLVASAAAIMFGVFDQVSVWAAIPALPIAAWELSLGLWLTFKGFRPEAVARLDAQVDLVDIGLAVGSMRRGDSQGRRITEMDSRRCDRRPSSTASRT
jgi:hypothetical protein